MAALPPWPSICPALAAAFLALLPSALHAHPRAAQAAQAAETSIAASLQSGGLTADPVSDDSRGRPTVKLDRLEFPQGFPDAKHLERHLRRSLARAARNADWGAGRGARIEYRVKVTQLQVSREGDVLQVECTMLGKLPNDKSARSRLSFGGSAKARRAVLSQVLEIVARGVVTRLAELERERRLRYARGED